MKKKITALVLALVLCLGLSAPAYAMGGSPFADVPADSWASPYIEEAYQDGILKGTGTNAAGQAVYSPAKTLSGPEFICIMARAFYPDEIEKHEYKTWFNREWETLTDQGISILYPVFAPSITRTDMAMLIYEVMKAQGAPMPSEKRLSDTKAMITDLGDMPTPYQNAVAACFYLGIITGTNNNPVTFSGEASMRRDAAATVYVRMKKTLADLKAGTFTPPVIVPDNPDAHYGPVGTMSKEKVTISAETHAPVTDYWSKQSADVQKITDKDAFNAACQTIKDSKMILSEGSFEVGGINPYYNYAAIPYVYGAPQTVKNVNAAMVYLMGGGGNYGSAIKKDVMFFTIAPYTAKLQAALAPYIAQITPNMTDMEKARFCIQAVVDKIDYEVDGGATWENGKPTGDCDSYAEMIWLLFGAVGIPCIDCGGDTSEGPHAWVRARIDGTWYAVDGTMAETGFDNGGIMSYAEHAKVCGYNPGQNEYEVEKVVYALIDAAYPDDF